MAGTPLEDQHQPHGNDTAEQFGFTVSNTEPYDRAASWQRCEERGQARCLNHCNSDRLQE